MQRPDDKGDSKKVDKFSSNKTDEDTNKTNVDKKHQAEERLLSEARKIDKYHETIRNELNAIRQNKNHKLHEDLEKLETSDFIELNLADKKKDAQHIARLDRIAQYIYAEKIQKQQKKNIKEEIPSIILKIKEMTKSVFMGSPQIDPTSFNPDSEKAGERFTQEQEQNFDAAFLHGRLELNANDLANKKRELRKIEDTLRISNHDIIEKLIKAPFLPELKISIKEQMDIRKEELIRAGQLDKKEDLPHHEVYQIFLLNKIPDSEITRKIERLIAEYDKAFNGKNYLENYFIRVLHLEDVPPRIKAAEEKELMSKFEELQKDPKFKNALYEREMKEFLLRLADQARKVNKEQEIAEAIAKRKLKLKLNNDQNLPYNELREIINFHLGRDKQREENFLWFQVFAKNFFKFNDIPFSYKPKKISQAQFKQAQKDYLQDVFNDHEKFLRDQMEHFAELPRKRAFKILAEKTEEICKAISNASSSDDILNLIREYKSLFIDATLEARRWGADKKVDTDNLDQYLTSSTEAIKQIEISIEKEIEKRRDIFDRKDEILTQIINKLSNEVASLDVTQQANYVIEKCIKLNCPIFPNNSAVQNAIIKYLNSEQENFQFPVASAQLNLDLLIAAQESILISKPIETIEKGSEKSRGSLNSRESSVEDSRRSLLDAKRDRKFSKVLSERHLLIQEESTPPLLRSSTGLSDLASLNRGASQRQLDTQSSHSNLARVVPDSKRKTSVADDADISSETIASLPSHSTLSSSGIISQSLASSSDKYSVGSDLIDNPSPNLKNTTSSPNSPPAQPALKEKIHRKSKKGGWEPKLSTVPPSVDYTGDSKKLQEITASTQNKPATTAGLDHSNNTLNLPGLPLPGVPETPEVPETPTPSPHTPGEKFGTHH